MINTLTLYHKFYLTKPIRLIYYLIVVVTGTLLFYFSKLYENPFYIEFYREVTLHSYLNEGMQIIKIIVLLYVCLNAIYVFNIQKFDLYLYQRKSHVKVYLSKVIMVVWMNLLLGLLLVGLYLVFYAVICDSVNTALMRDNVLYMVMFIIYYSLFNVFLIGLHKNMFVVLIPFIGYIIGNFSVGYDIPISEFEKVTIYIHLLFPDIVLYGNSLRFVYGNIFVTSMIIILCIISVKTFSEKDVLG